MAAHDSHMRLQGGNESESRRKGASSGGNELKLKYITEHRNKLTSTLPKYQRLFVFN
jgi:hypothetical protein